MITLRVGGVPEHFNLPWHLALERRSFEPLGVELQWHDYPGGSGAMAKAVRAGELDVALLLTEGAVAAIADGVAMKVASLYTESPLVWGIHVPAASRFRAVAELRGARDAISRAGSGSQLMAFVHARSQGWPVDRLEFVVVGNLAGAADAFAAGSADVFFWEKLMTKPLVDAGRFRRVAELTAPWPAFVVCVADALRGAPRAAVARALGVVLHEAQALRSRPDAAALIAARYGLDARDVGQWLETTRWSTRVGVAQADLESACTALSSLGVLTRAIHAAECIGG
ncbi:MAG TPA: PhnD/SsuA/transferrin family substrate-binding protein [Gammaproteobacteria bacterium]|nr:PhnD/SsuA/transferrin family substrate-binding protein [Gammaproteobacteria bacterium]